MILVAMAMWIVAFWMVFGLIRTGKDQKHLDAMIAEQDERHQKFLNDLKEKGIKVEKKA